MEEKIYYRQVTKLATSKRVLDEHSIGRHYKQNDLSELYDTKNLIQKARPLPSIPNDAILAELLQTHSEFLYGYQEHNSLLENKPEETLPKGEIEAAWKEFHESKNPPETITNQSNTLVPPDVPLKSNAPEKRCRQRGNIG